MDRLPVSDGGIFKKQSTRVLQCNFVRLISTEGNKNKIGNKTFTFPKTCNNKGNIPIFLGINKRNFNKKIGTGAYLKVPQNKY